MAYLKAAPNLAATRWKPCARWASCFTACANGEAEVTLDEAEVTLDQALEGAKGRAIGLVLGAEGPGLRQRTKETCDSLVKIDAARGFGSLNVSNAAAVGLYAARAKM